MMSKMAVMGWSFEVGSGALPRHAQWFGRLLAGIGP
jgi:hypothetical protein